MGKIRERGVVLGLSNLTFLYSANVLFAHENTQTLTDKQNYYKGPFGAYASPWSVDVEGSALVHGKDYLDQITVTPSLFPDATTLQWTWPNDPPAKVGVYGYMHVYWGNYDGGRPPNMPKPRQIKDIQKFEENVAITHLSGNPDGFNVLNEFYLTSSAGKNADKLFEIGFMLHTNPRTTYTVNHSPQLGEYRDAQGRTWQVSASKGHVPYIIFMPKDGVNVVGVIDLVQALNYLRSKSVISGDEWVNGIAVGVEPHFGRGSLLIDKWNLVLQAP